MDPSSGLRSDLFIKKNRFNDNSKFRSFSEDIVCFGLLGIAVSLSVLNASVKERFSNPYKECFVFLSNRCEISYLSTLKKLNRVIDLLEL